MPPTASSSNKKRKASVAPSSAGDGDESGGEDGGEKIGLGTGKGDVNEPGISQSESRRRARVLRNRASAQRSRDAKKNHQQALEDRVHQLEAALAHATLGNGGPPPPPIASSSSSSSLAPLTAPLAPPPNPAWLARRRELERENSELRGRVGKLEELVRGLVGVLGRGLEQAASTIPPMDAGPSQILEAQQSREEDKACKMEIDDGAWLLAGGVSPGSSSNLDLTYSSPSSNHPSTHNHASTIASPSSSSYPSNSPYLSLGSSALPPSPPALDFAPSASASPLDPFTLSSFPSDPSSSTLPFSPTLDFTSFLTFPSSRPSTPNFLLSSPTNALHLSSSYHSSSSSNVLTSPSSSNSTNPPSARWLPQQRASSISSDRTTRISSSNKGERSASSEQDSDKDATTTLRPSSPRSFTLALIPAKSADARKKPISSGTTSSAEADRLRASRSGLGRGSRHMERVFRGAAAALSSTTTEQLGEPSSGGMASSATGSTSFLIPRPRSPLAPGWAREAGSRPMAV